MSSAPSPGGIALAPEYSESDLSPHFKSNGTQDPSDTDYQALVGNGFADWHLEVGGLVERPRQFSLAELRAFPSRTQITRHDCVEGWSCVGKWKGVPLATVLDKVRPQPGARYVMFYCADPMEQTLDGSNSRYYESIDFEGAYHPQTILAYEMNDQVLPIPFGAPLRLRDERQLRVRVVCWDLAQAKKNARCKSSLASPAWFRSQPALRARSLDHY